jgi:hypothetical protein
MNHFPRSMLAAALADGLEGRTDFGDATSGLFLAAPRRTGKSTFLQVDLRPELESRNVVVVYSDLWADQKQDPGALISTAIGAELQKHLGFVARTARSAGLENVSIAGWLKIDTSKIGAIDGVPLTEALKALHSLAKKPVALIIDEAQHALTSTSGETTMMALKSARDQLNRPGATNLMLVMSGSDRDKLLRLVNSTGAPFYGSEIQRMPTLDTDFIMYVADLIERQRPDLAPVATDKLLRAFRLFSCRPQFFAGALGEALHPLSAAPERFEDRVLEAACQRTIDDEMQMAADFLALKPLEQAVLWRLLEQGSRFRAYDADALQFYANATGKAVTPQQVQHVLEALRTQTPAMVWKSARGEYAIDEAMMYQWYERRRRDGAWPPVSGKLVLDTPQPQEPGRRNARRQSNR